MALALSASAAGSDLPSIKVTPAGPERDLPIDSAYYITGDADSSVSSVQPLFVRVGTKTLFGDTGDSCEEFAAHVGKFRASDPSAGGAGSETISALSPGLSLARNVWMGDDKSFQGDREVFVISGWKPPASGGESFSILVPKTSFLNAVGTYCLFVYKTTTKVEDKTAELRGALDEYAQKAVACEGQADEDACLARAQDAREARLAGLGLDGEAKQTLLAASNGAHDAQFSLHRSLRRLRLLLQTWPQVDPGSYVYPPKSSVPSDGFTKTGLEIDLVRDLASDPFAKVVVSLLVGHQAIARLVEPNKPTRFVTLETPPREIAKIQIASDGAQIRFAAPTEPVRLLPLATKTEDLQFGGMDVTLRDLVEMLRGRMRIGEAYRSIADLARELGPLFQNPTDLSRKPALLAELRTRTKLLLTVVKQSLLLKLDTRDEIQKSLLGTESATYRELGNWLDQEKILVPCDAATMKEWGREGLCPPPEMKNVWPGYDVSGANPLDFVLGEIDAYSAAAASWPDLQKKLTAEVSSARTLPTSPILMRSTFSQSNWVFSYVTPVVGYTVLTSPRENFSLPYIGVQTHLVANPIDDPLWSRRGWGDDFLRVFALELGMVTGTGPWGPGQRFAGWHGIPPVQVALAIHILPYTSVSWGAAFLEKRSSVLAQEKAEFFVSQVFGFSVQANIPDLVASLKGRASTTSK